MLHWALCRSLGYLTAAHTCMVINMLLQILAARVLLPGGELSEKSW
jgi:hypothetical protein